CQLLGVSRSGYYAWKERPERQDQLATKVEEAFWFHSRRYGSRRIAAGLRRQAVIGLHRVPPVVPQEACRSNSPAGLSTRHPQYPIRPSLGGRVSTCPGTWQQIASSHGRVWC